MNYQDTNKEIHELIASFFTGELNESELTILNSWLDEDNTHLNEFNQIRSTWILAHHETGTKKFEGRSNWNKLIQEIDKKTKAGSKRGVFKYLTQTPMRYAASLFICLALGGIISTLLWYRLPTGKDISLTVASVTINAPLGSKSNIILPDGSTVWLNAGSTITYPASFGMEKRDLHLSGEAFFAVKSDSLKPFNVHTSGMTVRATGTRFNVKAYPDDVTMAATLEEGIVDVLVLPSPGSTATRPVHLKPKEQLVVRKSQVEAKQIVHKQETPTIQPVQSTQAATDIEEITIYPNVKTELSTSWKDKKWIIDDEPLELFVTNLERRYNLNIRFASEELKEYKFSGTIEDETVEQILTALSIAAPVYYKFDKNNVLLSLNEKDRHKFNKVLKNKL